MYCMPWLMSTGLSVPIIVATRSTWSAGTPVIDSVCSGVHSATLFASIWKAGIQVIFPPRVQSSTSCSPNSAGMMESGRSAAGDFSVEVLFSSNSSTRWS